MPIRLCAVCRKEKEATQSTWRTSKGKVMGNICRQCAYASTSKWKTENKAKHAELCKTWGAKNPGYYAASAMLVYLRRRNAVPKWLDRDDIWWMREVYALAALRTEVTGFAWQVDHIVPVNGVNVCGLRVPLNLQVIPAVLNACKGNTYEVV